jgi:hypothetical protein
MRQVIDRGWIKDVELPLSSLTVKEMLRKGWIKSQTDGRGFVYRITEEGIAAKIALIPSKRAGLPYNRGSKAAGSFDFRNGLFWIWAYPRKIKPDSASTPRKPLQHGETGDKSAR